MSAIDQAPASCDRNAHTPLHQVALEDGRHAAALLADIKYQRRGLAVCKPAPGKHAVSNKQDVRRHS
jgi:hypothetical protein